MPGDSNGNGTLEIGDAVSILFVLFTGEVPLPCEGAAVGEDGNLLLLDVDGTETVNLTDVVAILNYLFQGGAPPARGTSCVRMQGCAESCAE